MRSWSSSLTNQTCWRNWTFYSRTSRPGNCFSSTNQRNKSLSVVRHTGDMVELEVEVVEEVVVVVMEVVEVPVFCQAVTVRAAP